ncbi:MAG TPA: hypothetical protein VG347_04685, partial [Verrucomicrobiae bacterium]|nr:hypothetical protein [Verrucomicrobiae bacterium]
QTIALANKATTLTVPDILITPNVGTYNVTFTSGNLRPSTGSSVPMFIWQNNLAGELILLAGIGNSSTGTSAYVQNGPGTVSLTVTTSGYSGQSYLNGGVSLIASNGSLGSAASGSAINLNGGTVLANGTFALDNGGINLRPVNLLANGGGLAATAGNTLTVDGVIGSAANAGPLTIGLSASTANGNVAGLVPGTGSGTANTTAVNATGTVTLTNANYYFGGTVLQSGTLNINGIFALGGGNYGGLTFNGGTLQYAANVTGLNGSSDLTSIGTAGLTLATGGGTIDLNGNAVSYAGSIGNNGTGALKVKSSLANGSLNLQGANAYGGNTTVTNATLLVNNLSGSATGAGDITVQNSALFGGGGAVGGSVNVISGGTFAPNNLPGDLNIGANLTLAAGSKTVMQIQHSPLASDGVVISGTLNAGGTLTVTNLGGILTNGDSFTLFNAANYSGTFNTLVLPPLAPGLFWNTNQLNLSGILSVAAYTSPAIGQIVLNGDSTLSLAGSGGIPYWNYYVLASTNLMSNWTPITTNQFNPDGTFNWTANLNANAPQQFYQIKVP